MGARSPLTFELSSLDKQADFTFYFSLNKEENPGEDNREKEVYRKRKFTYKPPGYVNKFKETDILYIGIYSDSGCSFDMTVSTPKLPEDG